MFVFVSDSTAAPALSGFKFGSISSGPLTPATKTFGLGLPNPDQNPVAPSASLGSGFNFGTQTTAATPSTPAAGGFNFGMQKTAATPSTPAISGFNFGAQKSAATPSTPAATSGFNFGGQKSVAAPLTPAATNGFNFGSQKSVQDQAAPSTPASGGFNFGNLAGILPGSSSKVATQAVAGGLDFDPQKSVQTSMTTASSVGQAPTGFNFGAQPKSGEIPGVLSRSPAMNFGSEKAAPVSVQPTGFDFSGLKADPKSGSSVGGTSTASALAFDFGAPKTAAATSASGTTASSGFNLKALDTATSVSSMDLPTGTPSSLPTGTPASLGGASSKLPTAFAGFGASSTTGAASVG